MCCPFHGDKHPSMKVDSRFHCFACQADGDVIDFVGRLFQLSPYKAKPGMALLSEHLAHKLFGKQNPIGETFVLSTGKSVCPGPSAGLSADECGQGGDT